MNYLVKMRNPKSGKVEAYTTKATTRTELQVGLDFWEHDAGYTILSVKEVTA